MGQTLILVYYFEFVYLVDDSNEQIKIVHDIKLHTYDVPSQGGEKYNWDPPWLIKLKSAHLT